MIVTISDQSLINIFLCFLFYSIDYIADCTLYLYLFGNTEQVKQKTCIGLDGVDVR